MQDYENDRWRIISAKVGSGFSPAACREKAAEIEGEAVGEGAGEDILHEDEPGEGAHEEGEGDEGEGSEAYTHHESGLVPQGPGDPHAPFQ